MNKNELIENQNPKNDNLSDKAIETEVKQTIIIQDYSNIKYSNLLELSNYSEKLAYDYNINYSYFEENRYGLPEFTFNDILYKPICNNGYVKLRTIKGNDYWLYQNEYEHRTPDWKFHISVKHHHINKAWNLISSLFIYKKCWEGCKVMYLKDNVTTAKGREITVYIYRHDKRLTEYSYSDERSFNFWYDFFCCAEHILEINSIESNGLANGDLKLGNYVSLRNEAYVYDKEKDEFIYPPDNAGWNGAGNELPFQLSKFPMFGKNDNGNFVHYQFDKRNRNDENQYDNSNSNSSSNSSSNLIFKCSAIVLIWGYILYKYLNWE